MTESVRDCDHHWFWLPRPIYSFGLLGQLTQAVNVECARCGSRTWAHGAMPPPRPLYARDTPTTGRS